MRPLIQSLVVALLLGSLAPLNQDAVAAESNRPNILLLYMDDQRFDTLGCMGNKAIRTPNIDRLASQGTIFRNSLCTTSICAISRASLLTGQYARRHGIVDFKTGLSEQQWKQSFPYLLRQAGFRTGFIGKWGVGDTMPEKEYDYWRGFPGQGRYFAVGDEEHLTDKQARQALEFLDDCTAEQPFCLQISFKAAHCQDGEPWQTQFPPAKRYLEMYKDETLPVSPLANDVEYAKLPKLLQQSEARRRWGLRFADAQMHQYTLRNYYRLISHVDEVVGKLVARLEEKNLAQQTVIIYTSDNGFALGDRGLSEKWFMFEESIRVPLWIHDARHVSASGRTFDAMALNIDIAPTLLDLASLPKPDGMQGESLLPFVTGKPAQEELPWRDEFFYEHNFRHPTIAQSEGIRGTRWKYVRYFTDQESVDQLFDLQSDPREQHDLAASPEVKTTLHEMHDRCKKAAEKLR